MTGSLLRVEQLRVSFPGARGPVAVVDDIGFSLDAGETLALVGESGCGKSITALALMRLVPKPGRIGPASRIGFDGRSLPELRVEEMRQVRGAGLSMIFQEPQSCLNPVQTVGAQVAEAIRLHRRITAAEARRQVESLFERVGIPDPRERAGAYPHQLSGGLKQRVMIAMAISTEPKLLIADEPTTALDVTIQAQILSLLREVQRETGTAILLITHDFGVVNELADRVAVMYAGRIVEQNTRTGILKTPRHPYTQGLLRSIPTGTHGGRLQEIAGVVPSAGDWPEGCRFAPRCQRAFDLCVRRDPATTELSAEHSAACHAVAQELSHGPA